MDLSETIDALLGAIDDSCAPFEGKPEEKPDAGEGSEAPVSDEGAQEDVAQEDVAQDAMDAMEAVEENAEALLGETIDELLSDLPDVDSGEAEEAVDAVEAEIEEEPEVDPEAVVDETIEEVLEEVAEEIASEDSPDAETSSDEDLIDSINVDLVSEIEAEDLSAAILHADPTEDKSSDAAELSDEVEEIDETTVDSIAEFEEALDIAEVKSVEADGAVSEAIDDEVIDGIMESGADEEAAPDSVVSESTTAADEIDEVVDVQEIEDVIQDIAVEIAQETVEEAEITSGDDESDESDEGDESDIADAIDAALDELDVDLSDSADGTPIDEAIEEVEAVEEVEEVAKTAGDEADDVSETGSAIETVDEVASESTDDLGLDDLDAALAGIGDDLLMGDFEDADGELIDSSSLEDSIDSAMLLDQLNISDTEPSDQGTGETAQPASEHATDPADGAVPGGGIVADAVAEVAVSTDTDDKNGTDGGEPAARVVPAGTVPAKTTPVADDQVTVQATEGSAASLKAPEANADHAVFPDEEIENQVEQDQVIESIWQTLLRVGVSRGKEGLDFLITHAGPAAARGVLLLSKPLASKPAHVRDSIGYIAIWTVFLASILLGYSIFFKTTPVPTPSQAPTRVLEPGESLEPIEHQMNEAPAP